MKKVNESRKVDSKKAAISQGENASAETRISFDVERGPWPTSVLLKKYDCADRRTVRRNDFGILTEHLAGLTPKQALRFANVRLKQAELVKRAMGLLKEAGLRENNLDLSVWQMALLGTTLGRWGRRIRRMVMAVPKGRPNEPRLRLRRGQRTELPFACLKQQHLN